MGELEKTLTFVLVLIIALVLALLWLFDVIDPEAWVQSFGDRPPVTCDEFPDFINCRD